MSIYTTGEMAGLCGVSVRTVQFYDTKGLLHPSGLTEGGRRLYSGEDLKKLRLICLLKALGLSLASIKEILDSQAPNKLLLLLLDEQAKQLSGEISERQKQIEAIRQIKENIKQSETLPANSITDIEDMMNSRKKLRRVHATMLAVGILMDAILIATLAVWIMNGNWIPFAIGMPLVILMGCLLTRMYYLNTAYICPECGKMFRPTLGKFLFSAHTPKTRKLHCPNCGYMGHCVESSSEPLDRKN